MATIEFTGVILTALVIIGAYLHWAVRPALTAYRLGLACRERQMNLLIRTLGYAVGDGDAELLDGERPDSRAWYDRPMPLAVLAAILRPGRAVRKLRSADQSTAWMLDAMLAQHRKHSGTGPQPVLSSS